MSWGEEAGPTNLVRRMIRAREINGNPARGRAAWATIETINTIKNRVQG